MNYNGSEKYVAGAGTTAAAWIGTGLGVLNAANGGNGLGGILGGGGNRMQEVLSENAMLKAEKYSDAQDAKLYDAVRALEQKAAATDTAVICLQKELTAYETSQREIRELQRKLTEKDIICLADKVENGFRAANNKFSAIDAAIAGFTKTVIPTSAICDVECNPCAAGAQ